MAPRANWKGYLKLALVTCPVALYAASSTSDRVALHTLNRATGHRVKRIFVDEETGEPVDAADQVKGYEIDKDEYVVLSKEEIEAAIPQGTKTIAIEAFVPAAEVDDLYLDTPYYLAPSQAIGQDAFAVIRDAMQAKQVVGIARTVLFRRDRALLLRPDGPGFLVSTLHFDYEVRDPASAFDAIEGFDIAGEMLDLARHIIETKRGSSDPADVHDRYEEALVELIRAKQQGRPVATKPAPKPAKVIDLMDALRKSAAAGEPKAKPGEGRAKDKAAGRASAKGKDKDAGKDKATRTVPGKAKAEAAAGRRSVRGAGRATAPARRKAG